MTDLDDLQTDLVTRRHTPATGRPPTMLLLHGLTDSGAGWVDAVQHWQPAYDVVTVDQRGHGSSPRFTEEQLAAHPGEAMVDDAVTLLEQLARPVVVGHSLGGAVALTAGVRRPDLVRALVLEDPAPLGPGEPQRSETRGAEFLEGLRPSREAEDDDALLALRREQHPDWPESELLVTGWAEQEMDTDYLVRGDWKPTTPWPDLFAAVRVPTLVVTGDAPDGICVDADVEAGIRGIGNPLVTVVRIAAAGHCVRREQPDDFYAVVDDWLAALPAGDPEQ